MGLLVALVASAPAGAVVAGHGAAGPPGPPGLTPGLEQGVPGNATSDVAVEFESVGNVTSRQGDGTAYLWTGSRHTTSVRVALPATTVLDRYAVCLRLEPAESNDTDRLGCTRMAGESGSARTLSFNWSLDRPVAGDLAVTVTGVDADGRHAVARQTRAVHVIDRDGDLDSDKLVNRKEVASGTNLTDTDTDDDGLVDGAEVTEYRTDPLSADTDADGVRDAVEIQQGTDPLSADTDADGVSDKTEVDGPTDPTLPDTDHDGVGDSRELQLGTDPTRADSDGDGLGDGYELSVGTSPTDADTDGDLLDDGFEQRLGTDPTSAASPAVVLVALLALAGLGIVALRHRDEPLGIGSLAAAVRGTGGDSTSESAAAATDEPSGTDPAGPDRGDQPLTDRDEILRLLEEADGRLKQARIVERTSWSKAKVSRVLSAMEEDGDISKIRIGRENLICIAGREPDLARPSM